MIRAKLAHPTGPILVLGLSPENVRRLEAGEPILISVDSPTTPASRVLDIPGPKVVIMVGEHQELAARIADLAGVDDLERAAFQATAAQVPEPKKPAIYIRKPNKGGRS